MILPPFFGLLSKYEDTDINQALITYVNTDIVTYTKPTKNSIISYQTVDTLFYSIAKPITYLSYNTLDLLSIKISQPIIDISFVNCDILLYEKPPTIPGVIETVFARDKDSLGVLTWSIPFDGKSPITSYIIEYKETSDEEWLLYSDIAISNNITIPIVNNNEYEFRVAAVNIIGTGLFTSSNSIIPSGGVDIDCDIVSYIGYNIADMNQNISTGCFYRGNIRNVDVSSANGAINTLGAYFSANPTTIDLAPHVGQVSYPHSHVPRSNLYSWSLINDFSISFWIKPDDNPMFTRTIISIASINTSNSWKISYANNSIFFSSGTIDNMQAIISATNLNLSTSNFAHVAICRSNNWISLFVNGQEKNEIFDSNNITIDNNLLIIGANATNYDYSSDSGWGIVNEPFKGFIDEVFISKSALYRGNFDPPTIVRNTSNLDCNDCSRLASPTNLQVFYILD